MLLVGILSLYLNSNFIERYYLYEEKQQIRRISDQLIAAAGASPTLPAVSPAAEEDIIVVTVEYSPDNDILNRRLNEAFRREGISLRKYWLWEQDQQEAAQKGRKLKIYHQEKLNYSLLTEYLVIDDSFVVVTKIVPSPDKTLALVGKVNGAVFAGAGLLLFLCLSFLVHKIISPLHKIRAAAGAIADLDFVTIDLHTGDELELLAADLNSMSRTLQESHRLLLDKNKQMEELLSNVSHDLKTPVTLIKMYTHGIRDGMDDGTFLDTISTQALRMEQMVERLLSLAKVQQQKYEQRDVNISDELYRLLDEYHLEHREDVELDCRIEDGVTVYTNPEAVYLICSNTLSNAVKYSPDGRISIKLYTDESAAVFQIGNAVSNAGEIDPDKIWEPFYVAEKSRNKEMSGTGLGLAIVKAVCEKNNISCHCTVRDGNISFVFHFSRDK